ncbi:MAG TPA: hypothetical protein VKH83_08060 [Methylomirabilota bacterium]|nr:hypothetical protein [Methylomirabilota bacterium]
MSFRRRTYVLLVLAVIVASIATHAFRPGGEARTACGIRDITLAVEVCPPRDVDAILGDVGSPVRAQMHDQTLVDFALIAAYVALWGATGLALNPGVAILAGLAGVADVIENLAILQELPLPDPVPFVRWAALAKWSLLGIVFITFVFLFRPDRLSGGWRGLLRVATGLAYGVAGVAALGGLVDVRILAWAGPPLMAAVLLQLLLHLTAHGEFRATRDQRLAARVSTAPSLPLEQVLAEEYERIHGPLGAAADGGLAGLYEAIHNLGEKRTALCLSGGGIRSATFALGILQGLARLRMLPQFHYLSTVSGGGYIGSWLTAWLHRSGNDVNAVCDELGAIDATNKLAPEATPILHLRDYSNYLAPRAGLLSADTWTLLGTIMRNLFLVWSVVLPLLAAGLILPRLYLALAHSAPGSPAVSVVGGRMLLAVGALALAWAVGYIGASIPSSTRALRDQNLFLVRCLVPLLISVLCLTLYWAWWPTRQWQHFVGLALVVHLIAWAGYTIWLRTSWGQGRRGEGSLLKRLSAFFAELLIVVIAGVAAGYLASILSNVFFPRLDGFLMLYACLALGVFLSAFLLAATLLVGLISRWTEDEDREWWARGGSWMLLIGVVWLVLSALVIYGPMLLSGQVARWLLASVGGVSGVITVLGGWSAKSAAGSAPASTGLPARFKRLILPGAAGVFAAVLLLATSWLTSAVLGALQGIAVARPPAAPAPQWPFLDVPPSSHVAVLLTSPPWLVLAVGVALALLGCVIALLVNTNQFSLHAMYRARLIRAYLGASNSEPQRNPFTGFDERDNIQMADLWPNRPPSSSPAPATGRRRSLFHVVNMALNLVHGDRLAWQERKAHSFTVSPLHAGSLAVDAAGGYRRTRSNPDVPHSRYGGADGISLGTALTISGAAASPNMGYHSSPLVTFMMTFFNARLGWWLGNPGSAGQDTFYLANPRFPVRPIVAEAFGLTERTSPYVYLSDGGHFDNLGLYEMVLRRCHLIVVSDGSCDAHCDMNDLGGSIRKIRADLGIPIDFPGGISIYPRSADVATLARGLYWAVGRIRYSLVDPPPTDDPAAREARDGWLLYLKAAYYGTEPPDIYEYARANDQFPHESTVDQFFTESQFESYRMLGLHAVTRLGAGFAGRSLDDLVRHAGAPPPAPRP